MIVTLHRGHRGPTFGPAGKVVAHVVVPAGSSLLPVRGEPMLFVPEEPMIRSAWSAVDVLTAISVGHPMFDFIDPERN